MSFPQKTFPSLKRPPALGTVWLMTSSHNQPVKLISSLHLTSLPSYPPPQNADEEVDGISHQQSDNLSLFDSLNSLGPIQPRSIHPFHPGTEEKLNILIKLSCPQLCLLSVPSVFSIAVLTTVYTFPFVLADTLTQSSYSKYKKNENVCKLVVFSRDLLMNVSLHSARRIYKQPNQNLKQLHKQPGEQMSAQQLRRSLVDNKIRRRTTVVWRDSAL